MGRSAFVVWAPGSLLAFFNAVGVAHGETGFFEAGLSAGDVVGHVAMDEEALLEIVEHVAGARVVITRLADAADVDRVALLGVEEGGFFGWFDLVAGEVFWIFFPDAGDVGVAVEADERGLRGEVGFGFRVVVDVVELGRFVERCVGECNGVDISGDGLIVKPGFLGLGELIVGELKWLAD